MMGNMWVWVVIVLCGAGWVAGLYMALRGWFARETRLAGAFVLLCLLVTPAPVPDYAGSYAPALIVLVFEGAFQQDLSTLHINCETELLSFINHILPLYLVILIEYNGNTIAGFSLLYNQFTRLVFSRNTGSTVFPSPLG